MRRREFVKLGAITSAVTALNLGPKHIRAAAGTELTSGRRTFPYLLDSNDRFEDGISFTRMSQSGRSATFNPEPSVKDAS
jgi:hypothetical protein